MLRLIPRAVPPLSLRSAVLGFLLLVPSCSKPLTADECNALLDRYVELLARAQNSDATVEDVFELQSRARRQATHDREFARCSTEVSRSQFECAMDAPDADKLEQCLL